MKAFIKKVSGLLFICSVIPFICSCNNGNDESNIHKTFSGDYDNTLIENTVSIADTEHRSEAETDFPIFTATNKEPSYTFNVIYEQSEFEEGYETSLATDFLLDYYRSLAYEDLNLLDFNKYFDNEYLDEYVRDNMDYSINTNYLCMNSHLMEKPSRTYLDIHSKILSAEKTDEITYVHINFNTYYKNSYKEQPRMSGGILGIKNEKIVNIISLPGVNTYELQECVYGEYKSNPKKIYPNLWDDSEIAKRAVEAFQKFANNEYSLFKEAWDSLEKA